MNNLFTAQSTLPISVIVCTYNEENNICECLESILSNHPAQVLVIDGESSDRTVDMATIKGVEVKIAAKKGLVFQRNFGLEGAVQPYVAFVDADDVLEDNCLSLLLKDMNEHGYTAVQALSRAYSLNTYWEKAMDSLHQLKSRKPGPSRMVGRPVLHDKKVLRDVGIDLNCGNFYNEDTDLSIRHELKNYPMGIGIGRSFRKHPKTFGEWVPKWKNYGRGDARIIRKHPQKKWSIVHHQLIDYPVLMSWEALKKGYGQYIPFYVCFGWFRFIFMVQEFVKMTVSKNEKLLVWGK